MRRCALLGTNVGHEVHPSNESAHGGIRRLEMHALQGIGSNSVSVSISVADSLDSTHGPSKHASELARIFRGTPLLQTQHRFFGSKPGRGTVVLLWRANPQDFTQVSIDCNFGSRLRATLAKNVAGER